MALSAKTSSLIKSYWHAAIAIEVTFVGQYLVASAGHKWDWYTFGYSALGALVAPATRALVAKYPFLSPLAIRITTKIAEKSAVNSNSSASVTTVTTAPTATTSASGA